MKRPRPSRTTVARVALATARVVVVGGAAAGVTYAATTSSWSADLSGPAAAKAARVAPIALSRAEVVCPGPELSGVPGVKDIAVSPRSAAGNAPPALVTGLLGADPGDGTLTVGPMAKRTPSAVTVQATKGRAPAVVASQEWVTDTKDLRGLVSIPCGAAMEEAWLVAGAGAAGRQERLVLVNAGANAVTADVSLIGSDGPIPSPNGIGIVVPARGRTTLLLDALSSTEASPIVHVTSRGGLLYAAVNDTWLDGSVAAGSDDVGAGAPPARTVVVPAVAVAGQGTLRVGVVGPHEGVVEVRSLSKSGGAPLPGTSVATIRAGSVGEFDLSKLPAGTYAVQVTADVPVVAGAVVTRREGRSPGDFAWSPSVQPVTQLSGAAFVPAPGGVAITRSLSLVSTEDDATVQVTTVAADGKPTVTSVQIGADTAVDVPLPAGTASVWVRRTAGDGQLRGGVVSTSGTGSAQLISSLPLTAAPLTTISTRVIAQP